MRQQHFIEKYCNLKIIIENVEGKIVKVSKTKWESLSRFHLHALLKFHLPYLGFKKYSSYSNVFFFFIIRVIPCFFSG